MSSPAVLSAPGGESSPAKTPEIALTAKALGDWTAQMNAIQPGDPVAVHGPYGLFCANELDAIAQRLNGFHWTAVVSRDAEWPGQRGRLDPAYLAQSSLPENALYYLCGPVPQMEAIIRALRARGAKPSRIRFENFAM